MKKIKSEDIFKEKIKSLRTGKNLRQLGSRIRAVSEAVVNILVVGYLFYDKPAAGMFFFPYGIWYVKDALKKYEKKRRERLAFEFKDGMQSVVSALYAGYSLENSFRESLNELKLIYGDKTEIYAGFSQIVYKLNLNYDIETAFEEFALECEIDEITSFSQVLKYARKNGGNLIKIIKDTTKTICEKIEVKQEINTIISAKKLEQNIMNYVPLGIILYLRITSDEIIYGMYGNTFGRVVMTICLLVYFFAKWIADRITDIRV